MSNPWFVLLLFAAACSETGLKGIASDPDVSDSAVDSAIDSSVAPIDTAPDTADTAVVTDTGTPATCACPEGYEPAPNGDICVARTTEAATLAGTPSTMEPGADSTAYGWAGAKYPGGATSVDPFWTARLNAVGVWPAGDGQSPLNTWVGVATCVDLPAAADYLVGAAGDNHYSIRVDGVVLDENLSSDQSPFNSWFVSATALSSGEHVVEVLGYNEGSVAGFGADIAGPFPAGSLLTDADMQAADYAGNVVFSTGDLSLGDWFYLGESNGYTCPDGYALDVCGGGTECVQLSFAACE